MAGLLLARCAVRGVAGQPPRQMGCRQQGAMLLLLLLLLLLEMAEELMYLERAPSDCLQPSMQACC